MISKDILMKYGWISFAEQMPRIGEEALILMNHDYYKGVSVATYMGSGKFTRVFLAQPTHWKYMKQEGVHLENTRPDR